MSDTLAIPKQNVCTDEMIKGYLSWLKMHYGGLLPGCRLLGGGGGGGLVDINDGVMDFKIVDGYGMVLGTVLTLVLVNVKGVVGGGGGRGSEVFTSDVNTYNSL